MQDPNFSAEFFKAIAPLVTCRYNRFLSLSRGIPMRPSGRQNNQLRDIKITRRYTKHAEGSVLVEFGETKVLCNATVSDQLPRFLKGKGKGWVTAEYGMLPRSTNTRMDREAARGGQSGRTQEIQRLIARSLRAAVDLKALGERSITIDCDVIQADGGTRTASITGACVALADAIRFLYDKDALNSNPMKQLISSVSVGIFEGQAILDLDYKEDSCAETDMNVVMNDAGEFVEIQGTAEGKAFSNEELIAMIALAKEGIAELIKAQKRALELIK